MADDTPQQMINAKKRELTTQAVPSGFVMKDPLESVEVVQGVEGGETPTQAASMLDKKADERRMSREEAAKNFNKLFPGIDSSDGANIISLVGQGKITLSDPQAQSAAMTAFDLSKGEGSRDAASNARRLLEAPGVSGVARGIQEQADIIGEEFPEARRAGPEQK